jgi:hypothetical protein
LRRHIGDLEASTQARFEAAPKDGKARRFKEFLDKDCSLVRIVLMGHAEIEEDVGVVTLTCVGEKGIAIRERAAVTLLDDGVSHDTQAPNIALPS